MKYMTPTGLRDILPEEALEREGLLQRVQQLFTSNGYYPVETPTLEDVMTMNAGGKVPGTPFKFFDAHGDLLAMRPDVTLQIARMCGTRMTDDDELRLRYSQRVYRESDSETRSSAREMTQVGIECIGPVGPEIDAEVISLMAQAFELSGVSDFKLALATVGVLKTLLERSGGSASWQQNVLKAFHRTDLVELDRLTDAREGAASGIEPDLDVAYASIIRSLARVRGGREAIQEVRFLIGPLGCDEELDSFERTFDILSKQGLAGHILVDFSIMSSFDYYTGIIFEAYAPGIGNPLGSGGRYDNLLGAYGPDRPAAGFAYCLEDVMTAARKGNDACVEQRPLRIAVPKGSLNADAIRVLNEAGLDTEGLENPGRMLTISRPGVCYIIVRPTDAPVFVALGAADCGICGKDSLLEASVDVVELADLKFGACRFIVAEPVGASEAVEARYAKVGSIRVATKYPRITRSFYDMRGAKVEVVKLHGNIELAPLTGLAERIVDITATGTTLRENNLVIIDEVLSSTARFFANTCAFRTDERVIALARSLQETEE